MVKGVILSAGKLPYWPSGWPIAIWIRMVLENKGNESFDVEVTIDRENAEGFKQIVRLDPKQLLKNASGSNPTEEDVQTKQ